MAGSMHAEDAADKCSARTTCAAGRLAPTQNQEKLIVGEQTPLVSGDPMKDCGMVAVKPAGDLEETVAATGLGANAPPELLASERDGAGAAAAAELDFGDAASGAHLVK